jgi:superfamily II DNA or RNA helicase
VSPLYYPGPSLQLRPYQVEARDRILAELARTRSTLLVLATGLGKTVVFAAVAQHFASQGHRVLVLAHRAELLDQAAAALRRFGLTVGVEQGERRAGGDVQVVVASVQSLRGKRLARLERGAFGLVVVDESHHAVAATYRAVVAHFTLAKILGATATPDRTDTIALGNVFESVAYRMELGAGIRDGWLSRLEVRLVVIDADISRVSTARGDLVPGELEKTMLGQQTVHEVAAPLAELAAGRQTLAFVAGVRHAYALAAALREYGACAAALDGGMSREERAKVLADYRAKRVSIVCSAMILTEGFDSPETACVALVRPTRSRALLTQMIGRGTRLAEGKRTCLVLSFEPRQIGSIRLAAPADALAGTDIPDALLARVRRLSQGRSTELEALIQQARQEEQAEREAAVERERTIVRERVRLVREVGVIYAAPRIDVQRLLEAVAPANDNGDHDAGARRSGPLAAPDQVARLREAGFDVSSDLRAADALVLLDVLRRRRAEGLCTLKQARVLRRHGLRDDMAFRDACVAMDAIAANSWRPPAWLYRDRRFVNEGCVA